MERQTLQELHESLTGAEERALREQFGAPLHATRGYALLRAAQFRCGTTIRA